MGVTSGGRRLETHCGVGIFIKIFGIHVESAFLAVCSLLNIYVTDSLMIDQVVCPKLLLFCKQLLFTSLEGGSLQVVIARHSCLTLTVY